METRRKACSKVLCFSRPTNDVKGNVSGGNTFITRLDCTTTINYEGPEELDRY